MGLLNFLPLVVVGLTVGVLMLSLVSAAIDRLVVRLALTAFGRYLNARGVPLEGERALRGAYIGVPYRVYAAKTLLLSTVAALAGSVLGVYVASGVLLVVPTLATTLVDSAIPISPSTLATLRSVPELSLGALFGLLLVSSATVGVVSWVSVYEFRWWMTEARAASRGRRIDLGMPRMIAFMYALSRGGLELPRILEILRQHQDIYGEAAKEMAVASKAIDVFGMDNVSAIHHVSHRTPSDQFRIFTENLASVLQSGRSIPEFFHEQYQQYKEEAEVQQDLFLDRLGAIAEGYVALFVVGPLFLLTVLLIFGLISGGTQLAMEGIIYVGMPLLNLGFIYYLDHATRPLNVIDPEREGHPSTLEQSETAGGEPLDGAAPGVRADGGTWARFSERELDDLERLTAYDAFQSVRAVIGDPVRTVLSKPTTILYVTVPLAVAWGLIGLGILSARGEVTVSGMDDFVVQGALIVVVPYAVVRRLYTNRLRAVEQVIPDLFNRLASLNESGIEIVNAFREIRHGDLGPLTPELDRIWTDIEFGMDVERSLIRFERRTRAASISRAVRLITNGMKASGNIGPVLRIAADESRRLHSLKRERESEMSIYLIITYLAFIVFLTIVFVLVETFIPAIPAREVLEGSGLAGAAAGITRAQAETFTLLLFHASLIQATFSGLVAGQMSQGSVRDGALHVTVLIVLAYLMFTVVV